MTKKPPHLLILHNGSTRNGAARIATRYETAGLKVTTFWAANGEFPPNLTLFDGCFLTGSPHGAYENIQWIEQEHGIIQEMAAGNIPMLGVCFGSQILASALCGRDQVFRRPTCNVGFMRLPLTEAGKSDPLMGELQENVEMLVWHNDEVRADHEDMVILATNEAAPNQIWRYRDQPIWGIQGHPELTRNTAINLFETERAIFERDGANVEQLIAAAHNAPEAKTLLDQFAQLIQKKAHVRL
ncbi:MAG: type 1 glutamine amidotransferase [Anaerolineae bacterium]